MRKPNFKLAGRHAASMAQSLSSDDSGSSQILSAMEGLAHTNILWTKSTEL